MSESNDPKSYPGVWRGIEDELPVGRQAEPMEADYVASVICHMGHGPGAVKLILADRLAVVEMCRVAIRGIDFAKITSSPDLCHQACDYVLSIVKEKLK